MTDDDKHRAAEDERSRYWSTNEISRLRMENIALSSKVRELEETLAKCMNLGINLRSVLATYERGQEPTQAELKAARSSQ